MSISESIPSPTSTGGGGDHFEQHVDAFALTLLLVNATPPILINTSLVEIHFQTRHLGWRTDDLLLIGETSAGEQRKLAAQVKRTFLVSTSDDECCKTFQGMWDDFVAEERFDASVDRLAVITLHGTSTLLRGFNSLLECARATIDAADFRRRLSLDGYLSKKTKQQHEAVQTILAEHLGAPVALDLYWRFLRTVNILSFDLNTPTAQTEAHALSLLAHFSVETGDPNAVARTTWAKLLECTSEGRPTAASYRRENLPPELLQRHSTISLADDQGLLALVEHGKTVRNNIRSTIGQTYIIDRSKQVTKLLEQLEKHQVVLVSGTAGSGKSALAKNLLEQIECDRQVLAFQSVEFATAHINETLAKAQTTLNAQSLFALLAGHNQKFILIESIERLLEHSIRDAFSHLLQIVLQDRSIQLILTCRDYSLETVRNALLASIGLLHSVLEVTPLSNDELDQIQATVPNLTPPLSNSQLRSFLRTPYVLDIASRLDWAESSLPQSARAFREKCWKELIRADHFTAAGMPQRREKAFIDVAHQRAIELRSFVRPTTPDAEALNSLHQASLIQCPPESTSLFAPAHDVLEDWAILRWLDEQVAAADDLESVLADCIGGYPALRRGFRRWLSERFDMNPVTSCEFVLGILERPELPSYFRDDCLVSALISGSANEFLEGCARRLPGGDVHLLCQIIHMLRVGCKESPYWLNVPGLPSQMLVPVGDGWSATLKLVANLIDDLLPEHAQLVLGLIEDWAKQIDWENATPDGFEAAGLIVEALLPLFDGYEFDDARKRLLEVLLKIPRAVSQFVNLMERSRNNDYQDLTARDLADFILGSLSSAYACRDFPAEVIGLVNTRLRLSEADLHRESMSSSLEVDHVFGIQNNGVSDFFPASALQGPFRALLRSHPREAVELILDLLNYAGDWYGTQRWPERFLEPAQQITVDIPGVGPVEQWMNGRLYGLYRGMSVGPYALQTALMAIESWLLAVGKIDGVDLESWLLRILSNSNNVMATSVVASVCIAYPEKARRAGLALLSNRELIQCDRSRLASEHPPSLDIFSGINPSHHIYEQERKESNSLAHRLQDLEFLAVQMQLGELRNDVWQIIDRHRSELPSDQDEDTRVWRLALHRMDIRGFMQMDAPEEYIEDANEEVRNRINLGPGEIEVDVQEMVDRNRESLAISSRHIRLLNNGRNAWEDKRSKEAMEWKSLLSEAQAVEQELGEPEESFRGGPGIIAAVCVRDHLDELDGNEFAWCSRRIESEVRRDAECSDTITRHAKGSFQPDRVCAQVVPILAIQRSRDVLNARSLLALALTHSVDEVAACVSAGLGAFLSDDNRELVLQGAAAAACRARLMREFGQMEEERPYFERMHVAELVERARLQVREAIAGENLDVSAELTSFDFNGFASDMAIQPILEILGYHPNWEESRQFFSRAATWLAEIWTRDRRISTRQRSRNFQVEHYARRAIARFVLKLPTEEARVISRPLIDAAIEDTKDGAEFLQELIFAADVSEDDCFWDIWKDIADKVANAPWISQLGNDKPYESNLINRTFLNTCWNENVKHWKRLEGQAHQIDDLAQRLPAITSCLLAYSRFLYTIGQKSLPAGFKVIESLLDQGDAVRIASDSNFAFYLETLLRRYVYSEPQRVKSDPILRKAILSILDALITGGSSSAYRMRDDFVTPIKI